MGLYLRSAVIAAVAWGVLISAQPAQAQSGDFTISYDADGTMTIVNRLSGRSTTLPGEVAPSAQDVTSRMKSAPDRATSYDGLIEQHARLNNVRPELIRAVVTVESGFNPNATSRVGAIGLMQLMPETARQFRVTNAFDPAQNIRAGAAYLRQLLDRYDENEELALAAYNAGPAAVDKYGQKIPPYRETQNYVDRVTDIAGDDGDKPDPVVTGTTKFYRTVEIIDGQPVVTVTTTPPPSR